MTKIEFSQVMKDLANVYRGKFAIKPDDTDEIKTEIAESWYQYFKDYRIEALQEIVDSWITGESKAPMISDIVTKTRLKSERIDKAEREAKEHEEFIRTHDLAIGMDDDGFDEDRAKHPFEDGWRITDEGYWIKREVRKV